MSKPKSAYDYADKISGGDPNKRATFLSNLGYPPEQMFAINKNASFADDAPVVSDAVPDYTASGISPATAQLLAPPAPPPPPPQDRVLLDSRSQGQMFNATAPNANQFTMDPGLSQLVHGPGVTAKAPSKPGAGGGEAEKAAAESAALAQSVQLKQPQIGQSIHYGPSAAQTGALKDANNRLKLSTLEAGDASNNTFEVKARNEEGEAGYQDLVQQSIRNNIDAERAAEEQRGARKAKYITDLRDMSDKLDATKEDPDRVKNNMTPGQGVGVALGFMFGGMADALGSKGTLDAITNMMQSKIQRDINAQRQNYDKQKDKYQAKLGEYGTAIKDDDIARDVGSMQLNKRLQEIGAGIKAEMMRGNSRIDRAQGEEMLASLDQRIASNEQALAQAAVLRASMPMGVGGAKKGKGDDADDKLFVPTGTDGTGFAAATKDEAIKLRTEMDESQKMTDSVKQYKASLGKVGGWDRFVEKFTPVSTDDMIEAQGAYTGLIFRAKNAAQLGVLSKSDEELLNNYIRKPEMFSGNAARMAQLEQLIASTEKMRSTMAQRHGTTNMQRVTDPATNRAGYVPLGAAKSQGSFAGTKVNK